MSNLLTAPVFTPGASPSHVRTIPAQAGPIDGPRPAPRPQPHHVQELADQLDMVNDLMATGQTDQARAILALTQLNLRNVAAAMVTR